jgi:hypothetical protein
VVGFHAVTHAIDREAAVSQGLLEPGGKRAVVFRKKDSQGVLPAPTLPEMVLRKSRSCAARKEFESSRGQESAQTRNRSLALGVT